MDQDPFLLRFAVVMFLLPWTVMNDDVDVFVAVFFLS